MTSRLCWCSAGRVLARWGIKSSQKWDIVGHLGTSGLILNRIDELGWGMKRRRDHDAWLLPRSFLFSCAMFPRYLVGHVRQNSSESGGKTLPAQYFLSKVRGRLKGDRQLLGQFQDSMVGAGGTGSSAAGCLSGPRVAARRITQLLRGWGVLEESSSPGEPTVSRFIHAGH